MSAGVSTAREVGSAAVSATRDAVESAGAAISETYSDAKAKVREAPTAILDANRRVADATMGAVSAVGNFTADVAGATWDFVKENRGTLAMIGAGAICMTVGFFACAGIGIVAAGISAQQNTGSVNSTDFYVSWAKGAGFAVAGAGIGRGLTAAYRSGRGGALPHRPSYLQGGADPSKTPSHYFLQGKLSLVGGFWGDRAQ